VDLFYTTNPRKRQKVTFVILLQLQTLQAILQVRIFYTADHDLLSLISIMSACFYVYY